MSAGNGTGPGPPSAADGSNGVRVTFSIEGNPLSCCTHCLDAAAPTFRSFHSPDVDRASLCVGVRLPNLAAPGKSYHALR